MGKDHSPDNDLPAPQQKHSSTEPVPRQNKETMHGKDKQRTTNRDARKTVKVQGRHVEISREMTVRQIKEQVDVSDDNLAYLRTGDDLTALNDDDQPYEHVEDGDRLTFRSGAKKNPFGTPLN